MLLPAGRDMEVKVMFLRAISNLVA